MPVKRKTKAKYRTEILKRRRRRHDSYSEGESSSSGYPSSEYSMEVTQSTQQSDASNETKKRKLHEAQIIPGLTKKQFGFPNSIITKLKYGELISVSPTALVPLKSYIFRCNSCFDPDETSVGHQPLYYDQYQAIYDQYVVIGAKITVQWMTNGAQNVIVGINVDDDSTVLSTLSILLEQNNGVNTVLAGTNSDNCTLISTFEPYEMFGVDAKTDGASQTAVGSNPSEESKWVLWATCEDGTSAQTVHANVMIEYTVKFSELKTPSSS